MKTSKPKKHVSVAVMSDDDLLCHLRAINVWDSIGFLNWHHSTRLFGNANIGNLNSTNLQVAGQIAADSAMVVMNWYARTNVPRSELAYGFDRYAQHTYATMVIGDRPRWVSSIADLIHPSTARPRAPLWPEVVPSRQNFSMTIDTFNGAEDGLREQARTIDNGYGTTTIQPLVWVHIEGVTIPRELWQYSNEASGDDAVGRRWLALQAKVLRLITSNRSQQVDTAEHIARWISSMNDDQMPNEARAQLDAIADAVREGRWRPENQPPPTGAGLPSPVP